MESRAKQLVEDLKGRGPNYGVRAMTYGTTTLVLFLDPISPCIGKYESRYSQSDLEEAFTAAWLTRIKMPGLPKARYLRRQPKSNLTLNLEND